MTQLVPTGGLQSTSTSNIFKPKQIWTPLFLIPSINAWVQSFWVTTNPNIIETWHHQNIASCLAWKVIPFLVWWSPKRESSGLFAGLPLITWFGLVVWGFGVRLHFPFSFREYWVAVAICYLSQFGDWSGTLTMIRQAQQGNGVISFNLLRRCKANNWKNYEDDAAPKVGKKNTKPKGCSWRPFNPQFPARHGNWQIWLPPRFQLNVGPMWQEDSDVTLKVPKKNRDVQIWDQFKYST